MRRPRDVRVHVPGSEAVDLDAVARPLGGEAPREGRPPPPCSRSRRRSAARRSMPYMEPILMILPRSRRIMPGRHRARQTEHGGEVGREDRVPVLVGDLDRLLLERDARVVDEDVDRARARRRSPPRRRRSAPARDVEPEPPAPAARRGDLRGGRVDLIRGARAAGHRGARRAERQRDGPADAAARARDQGDAARERKRLRHLSACRASASICSVTSWRSRYFWIFPLGVIGNSETISRRSGNFCRASCVALQVRHDLGERHRLALLRDHERAGALLQPRVGHGDDRRRRRSSDE